MYLLDTNVISELRKVKSGRADIQVATWSKSLSARHLYLSVITIQELELGVLLKERRAAQEGRFLRQWLEAQVLPAFAGRILPVTVEIARQCARISVPDPQPQRDGLIAATALEHQLIVATRNVKDFASSGVRTLNPWETQS